MPEPNLAYWRGLVRDSSRRAGHALSADAVNELASHLADLYAARRDAGGSESEATSAATQAAERADYREIAACPRAEADGDSRLLDRVASRSVRLTNGLAFDVQYAWRSVRRQPAFSAAVVTILAVAIGASTAAYAVIDAVLLRPLPYPESGQLVSMKRVTPNEESRAFSAADWRDYQAGIAASIALAPYSWGPMNLTGSGEPERLRSVIVS